MQETFLDKEILEKITREGKSLPFYIVTNTAKTVNKP
jgi:hypothetical protein